MHIHTAALTNIFHIYLSRWWSITNFGDYCSVFLQSRCRSWYPINNIKVPKSTKLLKCRQMIIHTWLILIIVDINVTTLQYNKAIAHASWWPAILQLSNYTQNRLKWTVQINNNHVYMFIIHVMNFMPMLLLYTQNHKHLTIVIVIITMVCGTKNHYKQTR